jgi:hypothetical protein
MHLSRFCYKKFYVKHLHKWLVQHLGPMQLMRCGMRYARVKSDSKVQVSLGRIRLYLGRLERDVSEGDRNQALANCAEISEVARRLWDTIAAELKSGSKSTLAAGGRQRGC